MITAFGPAKWCEEMIFRWAGSSESGLANLKADDAMNVYTSFFSQPHTMEASNRDYEAGATVDVAAQNEDQETRRKIQVPVLLVWSEAGIGKRYDIPGVWKDWVGKGLRSDDGKITTRALGRGIGHFGAEEAPEETAEALLGWLKSL
jgi:pimeloyl-ACP methyl ester carboxylesterase